MMTSQVKNAAEPWLDFFAFGFWRHAGHPYQGGFEGQLRCMRKMSMNTVLAYPDITNEGTVEDQIAMVEKAIEMVSKYDMRIMPYCCTSVERFAAVAGKFKDDPTILGWYIRDEPNPDFLPTFLEYRKAIEDAGAVQPVVCLFYRGDSTKDFAPHQPMLLSDVYPLSYVHQTCSVGPHFGHREGHEHFLNYDMGKFLPWGNHGVHDWMELCRTYCREMPHWLTLAAFEGANGKMVRWREPTVNEMKLQVYQAIAAGVTGITYYLYSLVIDNYGIPFSHHHGEKAPMSDALGDIGAELTPFGPILSHARVEHEVATVATWRPTPEQSKGIEVRRLRSTRDGAHYLVVMNNDLLVTQTALVHLDGQFVQDRTVFDLEALAPVKTDQNTAGGVAFEVQMRPGHGRIYSVCSAEEFESQKKTILKGRCENEIALLMLDWNLAEASSVDLSEIAGARERYEDLLRQGEYGEALAAVRLCVAELEGAVAADGAFSDFRDNLEYARSVLSKMAPQRPLFHPNHAVAHKELSEIFAELEIRFWDGRYATAVDVAEALAALLDEFDVEREARIGIDNAVPELDEDEIGRLKAML